jgi:hypothetical protein
VKGKPGDSISTRPTEELAQHTLPSTIPVHQEGSRALQGRHGKGESSSDHKSLDTGVNLEGKLLSAETIRLSFSLTTKTSIDNGLLRDRGHHPRLITTGILSPRQL